MSALTEWQRYGCNSNPIRSLTLLSGAFDLCPLPLLDAASIELPPVLIAVGEAETAEFKQQSRAFAEAISRKAQSSSRMRFRAGTISVCCSIWPMIHTIRRADAAPLQR